MKLLLRVAWYRFRATFARRWGGYLRMVLLIGLIGGIAMGAVAGARRTDSSFPVYLASVLSACSAKKYSGTGIFIALSAFCQVEHLQKELLMARRGRPTVKITLNGDERKTLQRWARRHSSA
jgi:hypothetical protein